jgi:hypothetical protein
MRVATRAGGRARAQEADMTVDVDTDAGAKPSAAYVDRRLIGGSAALMTGDFWCAWSGRRLVSSPW